MLILFLVMSEYCASFYYTTVLEIEQAVVLAYTKYFFKVIVTYAMRDGY